MKILVQNRKARFNYEILSTLEAGMILVGGEVKSLRQGQGSLNEAFATCQEGVIVLHEFYIPRYKNTGYSSFEEKRQRQLLLHKREIKKLDGAVSKQGLTIVPLKVYLTKRGLIKVEIALARGKAKQDKRAAIKERDWKRDQQKLLKRKNFED